MDAVQYSIQIFESKMNSKVITNAIWMLSEKLFSIVGTLIVTIMTARYLGAEKIGFITYIVTLFTFLVPLSSLGIQNLIFDRGSKRRKTGESLIISTNRFRTVLFFILCIPFVIFGCLQAVTYDDYIIIILLLGYTFYQAKDVYPSFFNAILESKINVISNQFSLFAAQLLRALLVYLKAPFYCFAAPYVLLTGIAYHLKKRRFNKNIINKSKDRINKRRITYRKYLISAGLPLAISSISIMIYMRVGQIVLADELGMTSVGYYNAASTLAQGWVFVPTVLVTTLLNRIFVKKENNNIQSFATIYLYSTLVSLIPVLLIYFFGDLLINLTFGHQFVPSTEIIFILTLSNMFGVWGLIGYRIIISDGGFNYLLKKAMIIGIINVVLTLCLIKQYGLKGAAYSIAITEFLSATIGNYFFNKAYVLKINMKAITSWSYIKNLLT